MVEKHSLRGHDGLVWFQDGDALVIVREDFVNLQESPAVFLQCPSCGSVDIIPPAERIPRFTCDGCGKDFVPDLSTLATERNASAEDEVLSLMESTRAKYFSDLDVVFQIEKRPDIDGIYARLVIDSPTKVLIYYSDERVLEHRYRMGLVPIVSHELAHLINPVDPERAMAGRLPEPMMLLWNELREQGLALCSMDTTNG